jgi:hypothetical protein
MCKAESAVRKGQPATLAAYLAAKKAYREEADRQLFSCKWEDLPELPPYRGFSANL